MSSSNKLDSTEFETWLDTYGADASRWPQARRAEAEALLSSNSRARQALSQAQALDRVLDGASRPDPRREGDLARRIIALATAPAEATRSSNVVPLRRLERSPPSAGATRRTAEGSGIWQTSGLLAASLVFGLMVGVFAFDLANAEADEIATVIYGDGISDDDEDSI